MQFKCINNGLVQSFHVLRNFLRFEGNALYEYRLLPFYAVVSSAAFRLMSLHLLINSTRVALSSRGGLKDPG